MDRQEYDRFTAEQNITRTQAAALWSLLDKDGSGQATRFSPAPWTLASAHAYPSPHRPFGRSTSWSFKSLSKSCKKRARGCGTAPPASTRTDAHTALNATPSVTSAPRTRSAPSIGGMSPCTLLVASSLPSLRLLAGIIQHATRRGKISQRRNETMRGIVSAGASCDCAASTISQYPQCPIFLQPIPLPAHQPHEWSPAIASASAPSTSATNSSYAPSIGPTTRRFSLACLRRLSHACGSFCASSN
jgi:hypothetical protein